MRMLEQHYDRIIGENGVPHGVMDISNIADWLYQKNTKTHWDYGDDLVSLLPPFTASWWEFRVPSRSIHTSNWKNFSGRIKRIGFFCNTFRIPPESEEIALEKDVLLEMCVGKLNTFRLLYGLKKELSKTIIEHLGDGISRQDRIKKDFDAGKRAKWISIMTMYQASQNKITYPCLISGYYLDSMGKPNIDAMLHINATADMFNVGFEAFEFWMSLLLPLNFALSLMHCKNVDIVDEPLAPPKVRAKREKRGIPTIQYKTLNIKPMQKQARRDARATGENELSCAMHLVRGHFKDYRETGLFGKYHDVYWWEPHVRGDVENGVVVKDYNVETPGDER